MSSTLQNKQVKDKPNTLVGVGLRHSHYTEALKSAETTASDVDFVEVHAENFFAEGGASKAIIQDIAQAYPLSIHGTSLGLGSSTRVPESILRKFTNLVDLTQPMLVSEHLCFNRAMVEGKLLHSGDLLPIPYNQQSLKNIVSHIKEVQDSIQRPLLIENLSAYISASQLDLARPHSNQANANHLSANSQDDMSEFEFLVSMCASAGCGLLLDLNNLIINELNKKTENPVVVLKQALLQLPPDIVGEIHLAGYTQNKAESSDFIIDDHGAKVSAQCWDLYEFAIQRFANTPTLVEWDTQIPAWSVLVGEANKARSIAQGSNSNAK